MDYPTRREGSGLARQRSSFGNLFDWDPFDTLFGRGGMDVRRTEDGYELELPMPGFRPEDINISYQDGTLSVEAGTHRVGETSLLTDLLE